MVKETHFNDAWLDPTLSPGWSSWLQKVKNNPHQAKCLICLKVIELSNMEKRAIISHEKSQYHCQTMSARKSSSMSSFFSVDNSLKSMSETTTSEVTTSSDTTIALPTNTVSQTLPVYNTENVTKAEILWALHCVQSKQSFRAQEGISKLFAKMFTDSTIASKIQLSRTKVGYLITFGLAPLFEKKTPRKTS